MFAKNTIFKIALPNLEIFVNDLTYPSPESLENFLEFLSYHTGVLLLFLCLFFTSIESRVIL